MLEFILGGARSGKSRYAESLVIASAREPVYLATATSLDQEMDHRIASHKQQRDQHPITWSTYEEPIRLADQLIEVATDNTCILVDCLTLWLSNCLLSDDPDLWAAQRKKLLGILPNLPGHIILVSNEVGQGIVPLGEINRQFVDESGWLHQEIAKLANSVRFIVAGCALQLK